MAPALGVWRGRPELSQDLNLIPEGKVWWGIKNASLEGSKECRVSKVEKCSDILDTELTGTSRKNWPQLLGLEEI